MKNVAAYYLLFVYVAAMFKPLLPFVTDFLGHNFAHGYHISTVHHQHGTDHVHIEVAEKSGEQGENQAIPKQKNVEPVSVHIFSNNTFDLSFQFINKEYHPIYYLNAGQPIQDVTIPPPRVSTSLL